MARPEPARGWGYSKIRARAAFSTVIGSGQKTGQISGYKCCLCACFAVLSLFDNSYLEHHIMIRKAAKKPDNISGDKAARSRRTQRRASSALHDSGESVSGMEPMLIAPSSSHRAE